MGGRERMGKRKEKWLQERGCGNRSMDGRGEQLFIKTASELAPVNLSRLSHICPVLEASWI